MPQQLPLVVFSHLRWDFVYQRPQHLISRLAKSRPVTFIEEPIYEAYMPPHWERTEPHPGVRVCRPHTPVLEGGFADEQALVLQPLLEELKEEEEVEDCIAWLYTPLALPLALSLDPVLLLYDCMDELSAFAFAHPRIIEREAELLARADVVFTGGPSLYHAKKDRHPDVHCLPSAVDAAHFAGARNGLAEPVDQAHLPHPRLGFFGVIDERLDLDLLDHLAQAHPAWQIVMVGPVVKIDPARLPVLPNLHFLGPRAYADLPAYLSGWDVCLMPFARNEATRFISPTKTLEYMVAERPIVSTPITDVVEPYGDIVYLGDTPESFTRACEEALAAPAEEHAHRAARMRAVIARTSWDAAARTIEQLIECAIRKQPAAS